MIECAGWASIECDSGTGSQLVLECELQVAGRVVPRRVNCESEVTSPLRIKISRFQRCSRADLHPEEEVRDSRN